jgi:hypothetical protein
VNDLTFFAEQGPISNPGNYEYLFENLPTEIDELCKVVQGITIHVFWAERYGLKLSPKRQEEVQLRWMEKRLAHILELDPCPLTESRPLEKKIVGNCRDFTLLLVSILRHQRVPARARCGFGAYFLPDHYEDHWVAEYWNAEQEHWILVDAQLDEFQCKELNISFNPLDVPRDQFIVGGAAWQICRSGREDPEKFGIFDMHGLWFVRGDFVRDVAALNKVELLPWDCWGLINGTDDEISPEDMAFLDHLAKLTSEDVPNFEEVQSIYENDSRVRVGKSIGSYLKGQLEPVELNI